MKKGLWLILCAGTALPLFAQTDALQIAPGARDNFNALLNQPAVVRPTAAVPVGRNWFAMEMDAHVFTDQVSVLQVAAILLDANNQEKYFDGKKSKLIGKVVVEGENETIVDFISVSIANMGIKIRTPYRASVTVRENTASRFSLEMLQLASDDNSNREINKFHAQRYAEQVTIDGKDYTYIRLYTTDEVNASILPGAKGILEREAGPANVEAIQLLIAAAKTK